MLEKLNSFLLISHLFISLSFSVFEVQLFVRFMLDMVLHGFHILSLQIIWLLVLEIFVPCFSNSNMDQLPSDMNSLL